MKIPLKPQRLLLTTLFAILFALGLLTCVVGPSWLGLWVIVGVLAVICHRRSTRYWVASTSAAVLGAVVAEATLVLGILTFDPFFTGWGEAAGFFVRGIPSTLIMGLPIALLIGLLYRRSRRVQEASAS